MAAVTKQSLALKHLHRAVSGFATCPLCEVVYGEMSLGCGAGSLHKMNILTLVCLISEVLLKEPVAQSHNILQGQSHKQQTGRETNKSTGQGPLTPAGDSGLNSSSLLQMYILSC